MEYIIVTKNLTKKFGDFTAVDNLNIKIKPGEICGFLGPNGAGKSTAIRMLCGILAPSSGQGYVMGYDIDKEAEHIKKRIGYMSQKFSLYDDLTVFENLDFFAGIYSIPINERGKRISELLTLMDLQDDSKRLVNNLSVGYKQRLALASAIIAKPQVLFLDEPTSGVSPASRRSFFDLIQALAAQGTTIIVTTHFMDEAERCDNILFISQGKLLAFDNPEALKGSSMEGALVEIELPLPMTYMEKILSLPYVKDCFMHGALLHVLLNDQNNISPLEKELATTVKIIKPTLEDVFIALAKKLQMEGS